MVDRIKLLCNVGQFDRVRPGDALRFAKLTIIYAENGRGKTTLAAVLRSLSTGDPAPIVDRRRLGSQHPPHVVIDVQGGPTAVFQNGCWSEHDPRITIFDDEFVAKNVCSGIVVDSSQKQNLHELIVGAQGVALSQKVQACAAQIEEHNRELRAKADAIPAAARGNLTVDQFCALPPVSQLDQEIESAKKKIAATRSATSIATIDGMPSIELPQFDIDSLIRLLARDLPDLDAFTATRVQDHLRTLGRGGEQWVGEGLQIHERMTAAAHTNCPFCAQDLRDSPLLVHYRAYFGAAYKALKRELFETAQSLDTTHGGEALAAFERRVKEAVERRSFWQSFVDIPEIKLDTAAIGRAWKAAWESIRGLLDQKQAAPLDPLILPTGVREKVSQYETVRAKVAGTVATFSAVNDSIALVKEQTHAANASALADDLNKLTAIKSRYDPTIDKLCQAYLAEKAAKELTEAARDEARNALESYRRDIFPAYQERVNEYLRRFNAGFRLGAVSGVNHRGGSSANYNFLINETSVNPSATNGPSFRTTLSAGDRNALALAFFFASLIGLPNLEKAIVVIDDASSSLDEHRIRHTIGEIHRLVASVQQVIVLSHFKPFLLDLWKECAAEPKASLQFTRAESASTLAAWDAAADMVSNHDRFHADARKYLRAADSNLARTVAESLRHILENFVRVAYPTAFPAGGKLGQFVELCRCSLGTNKEILGHTDTQELRTLVAYANKFHHDTNLAYQTESINDGELTDYTQRTLEFATRPRR